MCFATFPQLQDTGQSPGQNPCKSVGMTAGGEGINKGGSVVNEFRKYGRTG